MLEYIEINPKISTPRASVIWMHGLGADGNDFVDIVPDLNLPNNLSIRFIFPHAPVQPITFANNAPMRAWFDIEKLDGTAEEDAIGIHKSQIEIEKLIATEMARGIPSNNIVLAGFSQGGAIALQCGLRYHKKLAGILVLSSWLPLLEKFIADQYIENLQTPILFAHGKDDSVVFLDWAQKSYNKLRIVGHNVDMQVFPMQHTVCSEEIDLIGKWLQRVLGHVV